MSQQAMNTMEERAAAAPAVPALDPVQRLTELLGALSETAGPSGSERSVAQLVADALRPFCDEVRVDALGNVIAKRAGTAPAADRRPRLMIAAHMDEIGLIVTKIEDEGFLRFTAIGGIDPRTLVAQEVIVLSDPPLPGFVGVKPPHLLVEAERAKAQPIDELFIDVGLRGEDARRRVRVGDPVVVKRRFTKLQGTRVCGKALDNRAGVAAMIEAMRLLAGLSHVADVYAVATVQEEVGLRGAIVSAYGIVPDMAIAVDVGYGAAPGLPEDDVIAMGKGPAVGLGANVHPRLHDLLTRTARLNGIPHQIEPMPASSGTDAWAMQVVRSGIPTAVVSIPLRYMHSSVEVVDVEDVRNTARLLAHAAAALSEDHARGWAYDLA
ncbi:MAG: M42 family metallopeptidase [Bacillota bacterium]